MGQVVGGFILPHDPLTFVNPKRMDNAPVLAAYEEIRRRIIELRATSAVIIGSDHYILFSPKCLPQLLICLGELTGPVDQLPGVPNLPIPHNPELAHHIFEHARNVGFDPSVAKGMSVDHAIGVPAHLCLPADGSVKTVAIYMASGVSPCIKLSRAHQFGQAIKGAIETWSQSERVILIGSGGTSHWVGVGEMGKTNPAFDRMILDNFVAGDSEPLVSMSDEEIMRQGGNGAMEIRQFLTVMGALPGGKGDAIFYDAWEGGITGLVFAQLKPAGQ